MNRIRLASLGAGMIVLLSGHALHAQGWGTLKVRFVLDGEAPRAVSYTHLTLPPICSV